MDIQAYRLYTPEQVRNFDRIAIESYGISGMTLMERAGQAAYAVIKKNWLNVRHVSVVCGSGNNAGDGYILARLLHKTGVKVRVLSLVPVESLQGDAQMAYQKAVDAGIKIQRRGRIVVERTELIVDALLGTGLSRAVDGIYKKAIDEINASGLAVLSLDIPSGLSANTGCAKNTAVYADVTVTFVAQKRGLFTADARDFCGILIFSRLGLDDAIYADQASFFTRMDAKVLFSELLPRRKNNSHKGSYGHVLVIGGNHGMPGSVRLSAEAALRSGAGKVTVATREENVQIIMAGLPELMCHGVETSMQLKKILSTATVVVIGPGLGGDTWAKGVFRCVMKYSRVPIIIDADGLALLAESDEKNKQTAAILITPHPKEAAVMLETTTQAIQSDRFLAVEQLHKKYTGCVLLKGAGSLLTNGDETRVCDAGNPGMATAGMGDLLSGVIAALLAQGCNAWQALQLGVLCHAVSGDKVCQAEGEKGLLASDLLPVIRQIINQISMAHPSRL